MGAIFAVLLEGCSAGSSLPLQLSVAKSRWLHTEPAAGALALLSATHGLASKLAWPALHLRKLNPHVAAVCKVLLYGLTWGLQRNLLIDEFVADFKPVALCK